MAWLEPVRGRDSGAAASVGGRRFAALCGCVLLLALAACGTPPRAPAERGAQAPGAVEPPAAVTRPSGERPTAPEAVARPGPPAPIPDRGIALNGRCERVEEDGFAEDATLVVRDNQVQALSWKVRVGKRGSCRFEFEEFVQTRQRPHIELRARDGSACRLMVWQDPRRITLAHSECQKRCTPGIYEQAWPTMFDPASGRCSRD